MTITVSGLFTYPIKSAHGIAHQSVDLTWRGLEGDRMWMIVDEDGRFITQRDKGVAKLATLRVQEFNGCALALRLDAPGMNTLMISKITDRSKSDKINVSVWNDQVMADDCGKDAAQWVSDFLGRRARLVAFPKDVTRRSDPNYAHHGDQTGFSDGFAVLITSESSLAALDLPAGAGMDRFRPNIVLKGLQPFEEDHIQTLQIGDVILHLVKPCKRCPMPSIDQNKGAYDKASNPLLQLNKLRKGDDGQGLKGVFFGQNAAPSRLGTINVGDEVKVLLYKNPHAAVANTALRYRPAS